MLVKKKINFSNYLIFFTAAMNFKPVWYFASRISDSRFAGIEPAIRFNNIV